MPPQTVSDRHPVGRAAVKERIRRVPPTLTRARAAGPRRLCHNGGGGLHDRDQDRRGLGLHLHPGRGRGAVRDSARAHGLPPAAAHRPPPCPGPRCFAWSTVSSAAIAPTASARASCRGCRCPATISTCPALRWGRWTTNWRPCPARRLRGTPHAEMRALFKQTPVLVEKLWRILMIDPAIHR